MRHLVILGLVGFLAACGESPPQGWNANLDANCHPQDPVDKLVALWSPEKFWRAQEYDMGTLLKAARTNRELSETILEDSRAQEGAYLSRAQQAARDKGLTGQAARAHVQDNVDRFREEMDALQTRLAETDAAIVWILKCQNMVRSELAQLGLRPIPFQSENRPR